MQKWHNPADFYLTFFCPRQKNVEKLLIFHRIVPTNISTANHSLLSFTSPFPYHQQGRGPCWEPGFGWGKYKNEGFVVELMIDTITNKASQT